MGVEEKEKSNFLIKQIIEEQSLKR